MAEKTRGHNVNLMPKNKYFDTFLHETSYCLILEHSLALARLCFKYFQPRVSGIIEWRGQRKPYLTPFNPLRVILGVILMNAKLLGIQNYIVWAI